MVDTRRDLPPRSGLFSLSRRDLLVGAGASCWPGRWRACGSSVLELRDRPAPAPREGRRLPAGRDRRWREGHHGRADDHHQAGPGTVGDRRSRPCSCSTRTTSFRTHLAQEVTQDKPDQWTIVLKQGIEFQDGKTLTADDVVYSLQPDHQQQERACSGRPVFASLKPSGIQKMDETDRPAEPELCRRRRSGQQLGQYYNGIVPDGY